MKKTVAKSSVRVQTTLQQAEATRQKGESIYERALKKRLEPRYNGKIICIDCDTEEFAMGETVLDALAKAEAKRPDGFFYVRRVGFPAVYSLNGAQDFGKK